MTQPKDKKFTRSLLYSLLCFLTVEQASAQIHTPNLPENNPLVIAEEQYLQGNYANSAQSATLFLQEDRDITNKRQYSETDKALFYKTIAALKLEDAESEAIARKYIAGTPNPTYKQRVAYHLAQTYFTNGMLKEAIPYYEMAGISNLSNHEIVNAKFELAYCYFTNGEFDRAEPLLAGIKDIDGKYYDAGNYYYGLLTYNQNKYPEALKCFERIEHKQEYKKIVPYYIAEIHYFTGNKQKALNDALRLIKSADRTYYHNELHLLAGQVYFEDKAYEEALPYFEYYYDNAERIRKEDLYEMAYCYYKLDEPEEAIEYFKQLSDARDSLGQTSMYLLGDCYLKTGDKKSARNAFSICSDLPFNPGQKEASLLMAAKLSYELGYNSDAIYYINLLLADFPSSKYTNEAKTLLSELLIRTRNYAEAYDALSDVRGNDASYNKVYQKVAYGYAMQQMQMGNKELADSLLTISLAHATDHVYRAAANFWKAELAYSAGQYEEALEFGQSFINDKNSKEWVKYLSPAATDPNAFITMGYAAMGLSKFDEAQDHFSHARSFIYAPDSLQYINAIVREADAVFMQKDYPNAIALYDRVIAANGTDADYAVYQKAIIYGLSGKNKEKINLLQSLITETPPSKYAIESRYELGITYIEESKYPQAVNTLMPLTQAYEKRNMAPKAWMKIGFAYQQSGNSAKAIESYKKVVTEYPTSEERPVALDALKNLYIMSGHPDAYAKLLKEYNLGETQENSLDSTYYATAEAQYANNNWEKAAAMMGQYLEKYPNGVFTTKAHYYKAESHFQQNQLQDALKEYEEVLANNWSNFSEKSALRAATIAYQLSEYEKSRMFYGMLRNIAMDEASLQTAYSGMMQCSYNMNDYKSTVAYADTLAQVPGIDDVTLSKALLQKARSLYRLEEYDKAQDVFRQLENVKLVATAAEARYYVAEIYFRDGKDKEAEEAANKSIQQSGGNEYWVVRSYILLADILTRQKDYFNAKATLQSIIKNCKIPELKVEATDKLEQVKQLEGKKSKLSDK